DIAHDHEQWGQCPAPDINDFRSPVINGELLEESHLAADVRDRCRRREFGQERRKAGPVGAKVKGGHRPFVGVLKFDAQAGRQRLADPRARGTYEEEVCRAAHGHPRAKSATAMIIRPRSESRAYAGVRSDHARIRAIKWEIWSDPSVFLPVSERSPRTTPRL